MQVVRYAKYVGTMIGPDGHIHCWTAPRKNLSSGVLKISASTKSLVERLSDFQIHAVSVSSYTGSICALDKATRPMSFSVRLQDRTMLYLLVW